MLGFSVLLMMQNCNQRSRNSIKCKLRGQNNDVIIVHFCQKSSKSHQLYFNSHDICYLQVVQFRLLSGTISNMVAKKEKKHYDFTMKWGRYRFFRKYQIAHSAVFSKDYELSLMNSVFLGTHCYWFAVKYKKWWEKSTFQLHYNNNYHLANNDR